MRTGNVKEEIYRFVFEKRREVVEAAFGTQIALVDPAT